MNIQAVHTNNRSSAGFAPDSSVHRSANTCYTVRKGDTLSEIVLARLRAAGKSTSTSDLYAHVAEVARVNQIGDPNTIYAGQRIDLGVLGDSFETVANRFSPESTKHRANDETQNEPTRLVGGTARISSGYGNRIDPINGERRHHNGIDIAVHRGAPIYPAKPGVVEFAGWHGGHGNTVIVRHDDGTETLYAHAERLLVEKGMHVQPGLPLAEVGSTGRSTGPHLHFEVLRGGVPVNPAQVPNLFERARAVARYSM